VLGAIEDPEWILRGYGGTFIAVSGMGRRHYLAVVCRALGPHDGFVITAYFTSKIERRGVLWPGRR